MPGPKREASRIQPFVAPCRCVLGETRVPAFLTDLSTRGCRVQTDLEPPAAGSPVAIEVRFGRQATHVRLSGTIRWTKPNPRRGFVFGVSFEGLGADQQRVLDGAVEEFHRRAASIG